VPYQYTKIGNHIPVRRRQHQQFTKIQHQQQQKYHYYKNNSELYYIIMILVSHPTMKYQSNFQGKVHYQDYL